MKKKKQKLYSSLIVALVAGLFWGYMMLGRLIDAYFQTAKAPLIGAIILSILLLFMAYKTPRTTEVLIAGVALLLIVQACWDYSVWDWNNRRNIILLGSIGILILDMVIGAIQFKQIKKIGKKQLGA